MSLFTSPHLTSSGLSRRRFIGGAGAALALASVPKLFAIGESGGSIAGRPLRVALSGYGAEGAVLLEACLNIPGITFVALCDIWDYRRKIGLGVMRDNGYEVTGYVDFDEMIAKEKDLDAVIVATPDVFHAPQTNAALKAGIHVYCEKMMSNTVEGAKSMVKTMKETGKLLQIGHQRRSNYRYIFARNKLIREARITGRITAAQAQWNRGVTADFTVPKKTKPVPADVLAHYGYPDMHTFQNWRWFKKFGGGPLSDLGAHQIDIFNWFFDSAPISVIASGGVDFYKNHEWFDNAMAIFEFKTEEGVARAFYQVQTTTSSGGGFFEQFMGPNGTVKIAENPNITKIYRENTAPSWDSLDLVKKGRLLKDAPAPKTSVVDVRESPPPETFEMDVSLGNKKIHQPHLENFFNAVRGKGKLNCPADEAFRSEYAIFAAIEAVETRKLINIEVPTV